MVRLLLDLAHALHIIRRVAYLLQSIRRNDAFACPALAHQQFHLQPGISLMAFRPDGHHLRQGISFNHDAEKTSICYTSAKRLHSLEVVYHTRESLMMNASATT